MNCTKCGKEIPDGENEICEECKNKVLEEIQKQEKETEVVEKREEKVEEAKENKSEEKDESKKKGKKKGILLVSIILIIIAIALILYISYTVLSKGSKANTIGNIRNLGYSTVQGNWIYYVAPNEDSTEIGIFKVKTNGKDKQQLFMGDMNILSMNAHGNYLYFIGIGPEVYSETDESDNKIYRMKKDGSDIQVINDNEFHNACYEVYIINNSLYYIGTDQNIYKMKLDGSDRKLVSDKGTGYLGITDKYIVYNIDEVGNGTEYVTYIMNLDGSNSKPIIEGKRLYSIDLKDDYVYYTNSDKQIHRTKIGSNEEEKLYDFSAYNLNLNGDYLYYLNYEEGTSTVCIYRVKADGTSESPEKIKAMDNFSEFINVVDDWVYYMDYNDESGFINMVKVDGSGEVVQLYLLVYADFYESLDSEETEQPVENTAPVEGENPAENATPVEGENPTENVTPAEGENNTNPTEEANTPVENLVSEQNKAQEESNNPENAEAASAEAENTATN